MVTQTQLYKRSNYNYLIDYDGKKLLYNGLSGAGFCMTEDELNRIRPLMDDLETFKNDYPNDFNHLLKLGYIVEDSFDEVTYLKYKNNEAVFLDRAYTIVINPTLECNFRCWYCYEEHVDGKMSDDTMEAIKKHIENKIANHEITSLHLSWFGGEPLLYFYEVVYPISIFAKKLCEQHDIPFTSHITTNASLITEKMIGEFNEIKLNSFQITLDGNRERHNKIRNIDGLPSYDIIMDNVHLLCNNINDVYITLRLNYDDKTLKNDAAKQILQDILHEDRGKLHINMQRVWQTHKNETETDGNRELMEFVTEAKKTGFCGVEYLSGLSVKKYYNCYVSRYSHIEINYDGYIYKCTARGYDKERALGKLNSCGIIEWDERKLSRQYSKATFDNPMCVKCSYLPICWGPCPQKLLEVDEGNLQSACFLRAFEYPISKNILLVN